MNKKIAFVINQGDVAAYNKHYFDEHPRASKPPIKLPQHPSLNEYMVQHNKAANRAKQHWKNFIKFILEDRSLAGMRIEKCNITYTTYFKYKRRHDPDNITPKYIFDGFVEAGFIVDDDLSHIQSLTITGGVDEFNPRIEFIVEILE